LKNLELVKEMKGNKSTMASANREPQEDKKEDKRSSDRAKSLDTALAQIERQFGKGSVMKMGDRKAVAMEVISCIRYRTRRRWLATWPRC
jgi:hypothetical protein